MDQLTDLRSLSLLSAAHSSAHAADWVSGRLGSSLPRYSLLDRWNMAAQAAGWTRRGNAVIAWSSGGGKLASGLPILAAHLDSPGFQLKPAGADRGDGFLRIPVEVYGGPIYPTWLDRPLGLAGLVLLRDGSSTSFSTDGAVGLFPNPPIHLMRELNKELSYNPHDQLLFCVPEPSDEESPEQSFRALIAARANLDPGDIRAVRLGVYDPQPPVSFGDLVNSPKLDNLSGCASVLAAFEAAVAEGNAVVCVLYDHEEIGSRSASGALSPLLDAVLERLNLAGGGERWDHLLRLERSTVVSVDAAHAFNPSFSERYDSNHTPRLGGGPALKTSASRRYATEALGEQAIRGAAERAGVPVQLLNNRADIQAGSTIGPLTAATTGMETVDIGIPLIAMHSVRETAHTGDHAAISALLSEFVRGYPTS